MTVTNLILWGRQKLKKIIFSQTTKANLGWSGGAM